MRKITRQKRRTKSDYTFIELHPGITKFVIFMIILGLIVGSLCNSILAHICMWVVTAVVLVIGFWAISGVIYEGVLIPLVESARRRRLCRVSGE